jgi:tetratricopeptide (TPR) repeat protein
MNDPLDLPEQTLPQTNQPTPRVPPPTTRKEAETGSGTIDMPSPVIPIDAESNSTLAAPVGYDPAAVAASTRALAGDFQPFVYEAKEPLVGGRYEVVRPHAKGGMGLVSVARDRELDREVALKDIQPRYARDAATSSRFVLEARVTGKLEHPGIVPVYGQGQRSDGRPYYAMRFVSGQSLQQAVDEFHAADKPGRDPRERSLALRQLLRRFVDVCNTIGFAHAKGFLHRDIKPANVMLGAFGETLVVDWGLAKEMNAPNNKPLGSLETPEPGAVPDSNQETREGFTHFGQAMGTPAFMSPEQAAGQWDITGVASDVYSLGAMLYAILTGSPPFAGPSKEVITKVQRGEFIPLTLVKGNVPAALDAVCRKAMALKIADRYPTAMALADDVDHWLADEPVSCYREPFSVRAMRWAKRHRTGVSTAAALLFTGTVALAIGLLAVNHERKQKKAAFEKAAVARGEARDALLTLTDDAVGEILAGSNKPTVKQRKFLDNLIDMYRRFAAQDADSPETQLFTANALVRVGRLQGRIGRIAPADEAFRDAIARLEPPPAGAGEDWQYARGLAHLYYGILKLQQSDPAAEAEMIAAGDLFRDLAAKNPRAEYRFRQSQCDERLGVLYLVLKRLPDATARCESAFTMRESLAKEFPAEPEYQFRLAQSHRQRAAIAFGQEKTADAVANAKEARRIMEALVKENTTSATYLAQLADVETLLTDFTGDNEYRDLQYGKLKDESNETESLGYAKSAVQTWGKLFALYPGDSAYQRKVAEANLNLADQAMRSGNARIAIAAINASKTLIEELNQSEPGNPLTEDLLGWILHGRAKILRARGNALASQATAEAVLFVEKTLLQAPDDPKLLELALDCRLEDEIVHRANNRPTEAKTSLDKAWMYVQKLAAMGHGEGVRKYGRTAGDGLAQAKDDAGALALSKQIAELKLPKGRGFYESACFLGHYAELIKLHPDFKEEKDFPRCVTQFSYAIAMLNKAIAAGFANLDEMEEEKDLERVRETFEYKALVESFKARP